MSPAPTRRPSFVRSLLAFAFTGRRLWMLPVIALLFLASLLALVGALAPYSPLVYPL
jgi:hypothetical protein